MMRAASGAKGQARDITRVRQRLDDWRGSHKRGTAFPPSLWSAAARVARRRGIFATARAFGLEYNKLKGISGGATAPRPVKTRVPRISKPMQFIELTGALPASSVGCRLSLQSTNGQRLELEMAPSAATEMVLQLCRLGWAARP